MANGPDRSANRADAALTIIAPGTKVVGEIQTTGVVKIEGVVSGTVRADRQVLVARGGVVEGDIHSTETVVGGRVEGGVSSTDRVEVQAGASVKGDVNTRCLIVQEGGEVNGLVNMTSLAGSAKPTDK
jgi:cytoskeletal protein CcmA (bactofilin family)